MWHLGSCGAPVLPQAGVGASAQPRVPLATSTSTLAPTAPEAPETPEGEGFTPEQLEEITLIVGELIAEALAGQSEEVGNTIATIFNEIRSDGTTPQRENIVAPKTPNEAQDGLTAFYAKMKDIKKENA